MTTTAGAELEGPLELERDLIVDGFVVPAGSFVTVASTDNDAHLYVLLLEAALEQLAR